MARGSYAIRACHVRFLSHHATVSREENVSWRDLATIGVVEYSARAVRTKRLRPRPGRKDSARCICSAGGRGGDAESIHGTAVPMRFSEGKNGPAPRRWH